MRPGRYPLHRQRIPASGRRPGPDADATGRIPPPPLADETAPSGSLPLEGESRINTKPHAHAVEAVDDTYRQREHDRFLFGEVFLHYLIDIIRCPSFREPCQPPVPKGRASALSCDTGR